MASKFCGNCGHYNHSWKPCHSCGVEIQVHFNLFSDIGDAEIKKQRCAQFWTETGADDGLGFKAFDKASLLQALRGE